MIRRTRGREREREGGEREEIKGGRRVRRRDGGERERRERDRKRKRRGRREGGWLVRTLAKRWHTATWCRKLELSPGRSMHSSGRRSGDSES